MNIIHLTSRRRRGSHERRIVALAREGERRGHSVAVVTGKGCTTLPYTREGLAAGNLPMRGGLDFLSPLVFSRILDRMAPPVVVHAHDLRAALVGLKARRLSRNKGNVKIVYGARDVDEFLKSRRHNREQILRESDAIVVENEGAMRAFEGRAKLIGKARPNYVEDCVEPKGIVNFIYLGELSTARGTDVLADAFIALAREYPGRVRLTLCGEGDSREVMPIVRKVRGSEVGEFVRWTGWIDNPEDEMALADVGVAPIRSEDGGATMIKECRAAGVPVITTAGRSRNELLSHVEEGFVLENASSEELFKAMKRFVDYPRSERLKSDEDVFLVGEYFEVYEGRDD